MGSISARVLLPPELQGETKKGSWGVAVQAGHLLAESPVQKGKGLGIYGKAALSDGNPNVIRASFSGGLAAHGALEDAPYDSFGVASTGTISATTCRAPCPRSSASTTSRASRCSTAPRC